MGQIKNIKLHIVTDIKVYISRTNRTIQHTARRMARGQQKIQSQQKNAERQAKMKKGGTSQKQSASAALVFTCSVCMSKMPDPKTFKQHFESKHPKSPLPPELKDA